MTFVLVAGVVFAVNLLPAFGPPTWAILVFFRLHAGLDPVALVAIGALAAATGRLTLAAGARLLRERLPARYRDRLEHVRDVLVRRRRAGAVAGLALFALSPVPSAQLFVGAGLLDVALLPVTVAFFLGRVVSYAGYVSAASLADDRLTAVLRRAIGSPWAIALQLLLLVALAALPLVDWRRFGRRRAGDQQA